MALGVFRKAPILFAIEAGQVRRIQESAEIP